MQALIRCALLFVLTLLPAQALAAPGQVELVWLPSAPQPDELTLQSGGRTVSVDGPHRLAQLTLLHAFEAAAARFQPPLTLQLVVQRFELKRWRGGHEALLELAVLDRRDRFVLTRGILRQPLQFSAQATPEEASQVLKAGLEALVAQAVGTLMNRLGGSGMAPAGARRHWFGLQVGIPAPVALGYRWRMVPSVDLELGATPGWPGLGASAGVLMRLLEGRNLALHLGLSTAVWRPQDYTATCAAFLDDPLVDESPCGRSPPALAYAQARLGAVWTLGANGAHGLGADIGYAYGLAWKPIGAARRLPWPSAGVSWFVGF